MSPAAPILRAAMRVLVKLVLWAAALGLVLAAAFDPARRAGLRAAAAIAAVVFVAAIALRRRGLGRSSLVQLDAMSGAAFEDYVAERVRAAGWRPSALFRRGDFGADLVAERDGVRVAVQAKRRAANVGNRAVQEALAGADFHGCDAALVVTQALFTEAARRQAARARTPLALVDRRGLGRFAEALNDVAVEARARKAGGDLRRRSDVV
jgi:restriction system protein